MIEGSCDCGVVRIVLAEAPETVTDCNCSICRRLGVLWAYYDPRDVTVSGETVSYSRGERQIEFHHCGTCGCSTHWSPVPERRTVARMAVNARLLDPAVREAARVRRLDGAETWKYLDT